MPDITIERLILFFFAVVPGVVAMQVYSLLCPRPETNWSNSLIEAITYSAFILAIWAWWVLPLTKRPIGHVPAVAAQTVAPVSALASAAAGNQAVVVPAAVAVVQPVNPIGPPPMNMGELTLAMFVVCLITPTALAVGWHALRVTALHWWCRCDHPIPTGWDWFVRHHKNFWVLFHTKDGKMFGGYFGGSSYTSTYPSEPDIYVEKLYRVNERGVFTGEVEGSLGAVIKISEMERLEFHDHWQGEDTNGQTVEGETAAGPPACTGGSSGDGPAAGSDGGPAGQAGESNAAEGTAGRVIDDQAPGQVKMIDKIEGQE